MKSIRIFLALIVAVIGLTSTMLNFRQVTARYKKIDGSLFLYKIKSYNPAQCVLTDTTCTYVVTFKPGVVPPETLPYDSFVNPPSSVQSIVKDGVSKLYNGI